MLGASKTGMEVVGTLEKYHFAKLGAFFIMKRVSSPPLAKGRSNKRKRWAG
jgi:hypothetical protein